MVDPHIAIVGGGVAGLSVGCYARASGFRTTIVEHARARGDGCANVQNTPYTFGGWAHCLAGGPFQQIYEELGIVPRVPLRSVERFFTYRDPADHFDLTISGDLGATAHMLQQIAPEDVNEIQVLVQGVRIAASVALACADGPTTVRQQLVRLWNVRGDVQPLAHFRQPLNAWSNAHLKSERLRRVFSLLLPENTPALLLLLLLGYLKRGYLSRPIAGMTHIHEALRDTYHAHASDAVLHETVEEVLVKAGRACGVRLTDGTVIEADAVVSTASTSETALLLRRCSAGAAAIFNPQTQASRSIAIASYGLAIPMAGFASAQVIDRIAPLIAGGVANEHLRVRVYSEDESFAPAGHAVLQTMLTTSYDFWARVHSRHNADTDDLAARTLERLDAHLPGDIKAAVRVSDLAIPLDSRSGFRPRECACVGRTPSLDEPQSEIEKTLPGLSGFFMAGRCVEPRAGLHTALTSARQVVQLICSEHARPFVAQASSGSSTGAGRSDRHGSCV
jgi:phytoene desaturase